MKYFKLVIRLEKADVNESDGKRDRRYWQNTVIIDDIDSCQQKRLVEIFKPLVEEKGELLRDLVGRAL
jgi:hypothetical protein